jgi:hypothetical protein
MDIKTIRIYLVVAGLIIGYFSYACYNGIAYWESKVEKNSDESRTGHRVGGARFYHK